MRFLKDNRGLTLVESLVSIILLSTLILSVIGAFFIAKSSAARARHRIVAMNAIKERMEQEISAGYDGGSDDESDYYVSVTSANPDSVLNRVLIDDRGTDDEADDLMGTIIPDPYFPDNIENGDGSQIAYEGVPFKIVGFVVTWTEDGSHSVCSERSTAYVSYHSTH